MSQSQAMAAVGNEDGVWLGIEAPAGPPRIGDGNGNDAACGGTSTTIPKSAASKRTLTPAQTAKMIKAEFELAKKPWERSAFMDFRCDPSRLRKPVSVRLRLGGTLSPSMLLSILF